MKRHLGQQYARLSRASENAAICQNINTAPKLYRPCGALSKAESRNLIGQKINKVSCITSVFQKKQHVPIRGRQKFKSKFPRPTILKSEVSEKVTQREKLDKIRKENLTCLGLEVPHKECPQKPIPSRSDGPSKVKDQTIREILKTCKTNTSLKLKALLGGMMGEEENRLPVKITKDSKTKGKRSLPDPNREIVIDTEAFSEAVEQANKLVKSRRESGKKLTSEELRLHHAAIQAAVSKTSSRTPSARSTSHAKSKPSTSKKQTTKAHQVQETNVPEVTRTKGDDTKPKPSTSKKQTTKAHQVQETDLPEVTQTKGDDTKPKTSTSTNLNIKAHQVQETDVPDVTGTEGSVNHKNDRPKKKVLTKRKRRGSKNKEDSDSTDAENVPKKKRSKRSTVSATEESMGARDEVTETVTEPTKRSESPRSKQRRVQQEIRKVGKGGNYDKLRNRSNNLFDHEGVDKEYGHKYYRRNPEEDFKPPPKKPGDGASVVNISKGQMLKAKQITDQQTAGKTLAPYLSGEGLQLRIAEAIRKARQLCIPRIKRNKRVKAKGGKQARLRVDRRLRYAMVTFRRMARASNALDQWLNEFLGAYPVYKDQSKIPYLCLETDTVLKNKKRDSAKKLINVLQFLIPSFELGNKKGDAKIFDVDGNLDIVKTEPESEGETTPTDTETETSEDEAEKDGDTPAPTQIVNAQEEEATSSNDPQQVSSEPQTPAPQSMRPESDSNNPPQGPLGTQPPAPAMEPQSMGPDSDSEIEIVSETPIKPKPPPMIINIDSEDNEEQVSKVKVELKTEPGANPLTTTGPEDQAAKIAKLEAQVKALSNAMQMKLESRPATETPRPKREPKVEEPNGEENEEVQNINDNEDTERFIQDLQDHLATQEDPHTPPPLSSPDEESGMEESESNNKTRIDNMSGYESEIDIESQLAIREEVLADSVEEIAADTDDAHSGIETVEEDQEEITNSEEQSPKETEETPCKPSLIPSSMKPTVVLERCDAPETDDTERNNNTEKPRLVLVLNNHLATGRQDSQLVVHLTPVRFPAGGNLMENQTTARYIAAALESVTNPDELPEDTVVFASLRNSMENKQKYATVIVEVKSPDLKTRIMKGVHAKKGKSKFYITDIPQRQYPSRNMTYSDEEVEHKPKKCPKEKKDKRSPKSSKNKKKESHASTKSDTGKQPPKKTSKQANENMGPTTSTPLPNVPRINREATIDALAGLVNQVRESIPVPRIDAPPPPINKKPIDTSKLDMKMTVEVENDRYIPITENTPPTDDQMASDRGREDLDRAECQVLETELTRSIDVLRRWALSPEDDDLRKQLKRKIGPADLRNINKDLRETIRRHSDHYDLRNTVLNRDRDLRVQLNRRRASSVPPNHLSTFRQLKNSDSFLEELSALEQSVIRGIDILESSTARTETEIRKLRNQVAGNESKSEREYDSNVTSAPDSFSEGEVQPSEDEMINVRFSDIETSSREPQPGPSSSQGRTIPRTPVKNRPKGMGKQISPIKFPSSTPAKNKEDVPLKKLNNKPSYVTDLRARLSGAPFDWTRVGRRNMKPEEVWNPFVQGITPSSRPIYDLRYYDEHLSPWLDASVNQRANEVPHRSRSFIEGLSTSRDESTMTDRDRENSDQEDEEVQNGTRDDVTDSEFNERGDHKQ